MCPMCSDPVTLGGGMTSEKMGPGLLASARKMPESIHHCAQCGSNRSGSYTLSICMGDFHFSRGGNGCDLGNPERGNAKTEVEEVRMKRESRAAGGWQAKAPGESACPTRFEDTCGVRNKGVAAAGALGLFAGRVSGFSRTL